MTYPNNRIKIFDFCEFCDYFGENREWRIEKSEERREKNEG